jgi:hypothetical protein
MVLLSLLAAAHAQSIVGGEVDGDHPEVVSLGIALGEQWYSLCTGTLITPRVVLSAAHCAADYSIESVVQFGRARFGADTAEPEATLAFVGGTVHPDYVPLDGFEISSADLALLELAEDGPARPAELRIDPLPPDEELLGLPLRSVGYGITGGSADDSGVRRAVELEVHDADAEFLYIRQDGANICSGDSGGPQFGYEDGGRLVEWAVHSWGQQGCTGLSASTRVDAYADWILDYVEAVHGTRDLCGAAGRYADGTCDAFCAELDPDCLEGMPWQGGGEPRAGCASRPGGVAPGAALAALLALGLRRRRAGA